MHLERRSFVPPEERDALRMTQFSDEEEGLTNHLKVTVFALGGAGRLLNELEELA
jgi:hypothetical protein